jgi:hypothetical protein
LLTRNVTFYLKVILKTVPGSDLVGNILKAFRDVLLLKFVLRDPGINSRPYQIFWEIGGWKGVHSAS